MSEIRVCVVCGSEFPKDGRRILCSPECQKARRKEQEREWWERLRRETSTNGQHRYYYAWRSKRLRRYGLTPDEWDAMFAAQGSACAACGTKESKPYWHTDHCHTTGKVRGILCLSCNTALGNASDDPVRLRRLYEYLSGEMLV